MSFAQPHVDYARSFHRDRATTTSTLSEITLLCAWAVIGLAVSAYLLVPETYADLGSFMAFAG